MKKLKLNNRGSTLAMTIIIMAILTLLGTTILSLAVTNYKMNSIRSKAKKNFYFAESGLDEAYGILGTVIDSAIEKGNESARVYLNNLDLEEEILKEENGIDGEPYNSPYINNDGTINFTLIEEEQNTAFQNGYNDSRNGYIDILKDTLETKINLESNYLIYDDEYPKIDAEFDNNDFILTVTSTYKKDNIKKTLQAKYKILIPEYNQPYYSEANVVTIPKHIIWSKAMAIGGDLTVKNGDLTIDGDIYVRGNDSANGGIRLVDSCESITVHGKIATAENFLVNSNNVIKKTVNIKNGNVFAKNFVITKKSQNSEVNLKKLYTLDDLEINGKKSIVTIDGGYYGVSDGSAYLEHNHSSSIIINADDLGKENGSKLAINGEVIIPGTSYINTSKSEFGDYQTGESLSIKGNYIAYTKSLENESIAGEYYKDNVKFEYYNPLVLAHGFANGNKFNVVNKAKYFKLYEEIYKENNELNLGENDGVIINSNDGNKPISIGVLVSDGEVIERAIIPNFGKIIDGLKDAYDDEVISMGIDFSFDNRQKFTVENQINFNNKLVSYNEGEKELIIIDGSNTNYAILGSGANESVPSEFEVIRLNGDSVKGIIITKGKLHFYGDIDYRGTIISTNDVVLSEDSNKEFTYDENYIKRRIAENWEFSKDIFTGYSEGDISVELDQIIKDDSDIGKTIIKDKLVKLEEWKIIK